MGRGGSRGPPGQPPGPPECTFFWVFNNSPSRDKDGTLFGTDFWDKNRPSRNGWDSPDGGYGGTGLGQGGLGGYRGVQGGTWEDYDSEFDLEDCRQNRIPAYVEFEIGVWSSALWTSDMKWEKPVVTEAEEVVGWGVPFDHLNNTSSNGTWSSSSSSGDEGARKDTFDESDFCDSPINGADDSVSTDEGIVASDDEVSEKAVSEKIKKVIVDEPSPLVVNTV